MGWRMGWPRGLAQASNQINALDLKSGGWGVRHTSVFWRPLLFWPIHLFLAFLRLFEDF